MPRTKTDTADPHAELEQATQARAALLDRIAAGDTIKPGAVLDADAAVRLAELRVEASAEWERRRVEQARVARADEIRRSLADTDGELRTRAQRSLELYDQAVAALAALYAAVDERERSFAADATELRRMLRDGPLDGIRPDELSGGVTIDDHRYQLDSRRALRFVIEALGDVLDERGYRSEAADIRRHARVSAAHSPVNVLRSQLADTDGEDDAA